MEFLLSPKAELLLFLSKQQQGKLIANESSNFFKSYQDLMEILNEVNDQDENIFKFIYHYKTNIHQILYDSDESINVNNFKLKNNFEELFYLALLISDNEEILNYTYDFDLLNKWINLTFFEYKNDTIFYKIVGCKLLLILINNFTSSDNYDEEINSEDIDKIN